MNPHPLQHTPPSPVLTKVRYELLPRLLGSRAAALNFAVSFALNWVLGPALMAALAWACLPDLPAFRSGVIMVGLARCIAMVLIWNDVRRGAALSQVCVWSIHCVGVFAWGARCCRRARCIAMVLNWNDASVTFYAR